MINAIPLVGWALSFAVSASLAVPFWFVWTVCGIGETYFYFLPSVYHHPGFWDCVGFFIVVSILKLMVPTIMRVDSSSESKSD